MHAMSYHVLHITTPNSKLSVNSGLLFCKCGEDTKKIALADVKAIVVATFGVYFSNNCLAKLLENDVVILHCNEKYQPTGWSLPLERIVRKKIFFNQISQNGEFEIKLWRKILQCKVTNQAKNLDLIGCKEHNLYKLIDKPLMSEANIAKYYWQNYFVQLGRPLAREHMNAATFENACLNYGYAIIKILIYRSVIVHGMLAGLGIHHIGKYKSTPLVYDLMEVYRPFVDYYLYRFVKTNSESFVEEDFKEWAKFVAESIKKYRIEIGGISYKIVDSIDIFVEKIADAYLNFDSTNVFLPELDKQYLYLDKHRNRENEE